MSNCNLIARVYQIRVRSKCSVPVKRFNLGKSSKINFLFPELILLKLGLVNIRQHSELLETSKYH